MMVCDGMVQTNFRRQTSCSTHQWVSIDGEIKVWIAGNGDEAQTVAEVLGNTDNGKGNDGAIDVTAFAIDQRRHRVGDETR